MALRLLWPGNNFGKIELVETSGASKETAKQDELGYSGVEASHTMAETDRERMTQYKELIHNIGSRHGVDKYLIAAIISRESRAGNALTDGWGDWSDERNAWNAWGLMQVDVNPNRGGHTAIGGWDSGQHLNQATEILVHFINRISKKFPHWSKEQQLKGGIAAYNMGDGNVDSYSRVDEHTTGRDYSNDVIARAQWYKENGYWRNCAVS
ncbi:lysozyme g-like [Limanda limanda]|uniref:lysozyme g-like n=1 Tax=Limanda limanda TaxID=27771 RepID=UPI0029C8893F|nr:lysozyme g-like [Limanda limanda]